MGTQWSRRDSNFQKRNLLTEIRLVTSIALCNWMKSTSLGLKRNGTWRCYWIMWETKGRLRQISQNQCFPLIQKSGNRWRADFTCCIEIHPSSRLSFVELVPDLAINILLYPPSASFLISLLWHQLSNSSVTLYNLRFLSSDCPLVTNINLIITPEPPWRSVYINFSQHQHFQVVFAMFVKVLAILAAGVSVINAECAYPPGLVSSIT